MPRVKISSLDIFLTPNRSISQERFFKHLRTLFDEYASFYGFEQIYVPLFSDVRSFGTLGKSGFFNEKAPINCRLKAEFDMVLRFSGSLSVLRSYVIDKMNDLPHPLKLFFTGGVFFSSPVKKSNFNNSYECGLVMIGEEGPIAETEVIYILRKTLESLDIDTNMVELHINAIGCADCRPAFRSAFVSFLRSRINRICKVCRRAFRRAPTRIFNCREEGCRIITSSVPQILDFLCDVCKKHLRGVLEFLDEAQISYFLDNKLFRDGSWYNTLVFEIVYSQNTESGGAGVIVAEGGRISRVGEIVVGRKIDAVSGILIGESIERAVLKVNPSLFEPKKPMVFLVQLGELAKRKSLGLVEILRSGGISMQESLGRDSIKSQLKIAERVGAELALILGQREAIDRTIIVREVQSGIQETISQDALVEFLKKKLKK